MEQKSKVYLIIFIVVGLIAIGGVAWAYQQGWFKSSADIAKTPSTSPSSSTTDMQNKINAYMNSTEGKDLVKQMVKASQISRSSGSTSPSPSSSPVPGSPEDIGKTILANLKKMFKDPNECFPLFFSGSYNMCDEGNNILCFTITIKVYATTPKNRIPSGCYAEPSGESIFSGNWSYLYDPLNDTLTKTTKCNCQSGIGYSFTDLLILPDKCCPILSATPNTSRSGTPRP